MGEGDVRDDTNEGRRRRTAEGMSVGGLGCALGVSANGCVRVDTITSESARVRFSVVMAVRSGFELALFVLDGTSPAQLLPRSNTYHTKELLKLNYHRSDIELQLLKATVIS